MKYLGVLLVGILMFTFGCDDNTTALPTISEEEQLVIDINLIDNWITDNGIADAKIHKPTEIRYTINTKGTGIRAEVGDVLRVGYEGRFLDTGVVFDSSVALDPFVLNSGGIIAGWYFMLQEMDEGDEFTIYIPSKLAYGTRGNRTIPPNTILVFDIKLIRVGI